MPCNVPVNIPVELEGGHVAVRALPQAGSGVLLPIEGGEGPATPRPVKGDVKIGMETENF